MMAELWAWAQAYPVLATIFGLILWLTTGLFAAMVWALIRLPPNTLDAAQDDDEEFQAVTKPAPLPVSWGRSGGNWWGKL